MSNQSVRRRRDIPPIRQSLPAGSFEPIPRLRSVPSTLEPTSTIREPNQLCHPCGSPDMAESDPIATPGWFRWSCLRCGSPHAVPISPASSPTSEWAATVRLDFGKHRGRTIGELGRTSYGRSYLRWLADEVRHKPIAVQAARLALAEYSASETPCPRCGSNQVIEVRLTAGPHFARLECSSCGRCHRFLPWPRRRPKR